MKLVFSELYGINNTISSKKSLRGNCIPIIEIYYTDEEIEKLPDLNPEYIDDIEDCDLNIAYLNFSYGLFSSLSDNTKAKIDNMLKFCCKTYLTNYICKDYWKAFLLTSNIEINPIKKTINSNISPFDKSTARYKGKNGILPSFHKDERQRKVQNYYSSTNNDFDKKIYILQNDLYNDLLKNFIKENIKDKNEDLKPQYKINFPENNFISVVNIMRNGYLNGAVSINYEFEFKNEIELIYSFLDCIFTSEYKFYIKKCKKCENFFIALKTNKRHCLNCEKIEIKSRKLKFERKNIIKLERKINSLFNAPNVSAIERSKYFLDKKENKALFQNDEQSLKNWFLSHYKTEEARKRNDYKI